MAYNTTTNTFELTAEMQRLLDERKSALELQMRKHEDWDDNYMLYRSKVKTNRLTQRQAVNIPLMKETLKTLLSRIDDPPNIDWKERGSDLVKQMIYQAVWDETMRANHAELIDVLDKKNVLMYGFSVKKLNPSPDGVRVSVLDPFDILIDPLTTPWDLDGARFIIHQNIFKTAREILADPSYDQAGKDELKIWVDTAPGITQGSVNKEEWEKKMERLKAMGVDQGDFGLFAGGDRLINLSEHCTREWDASKKKFVRYVYVYADSTIKLKKQTLKAAIGVDDFWPYVKWAEDPENNDIYPDSVADLIRTPNKVLNVWFSQMLENRTLKNFQMHWYSPKEGYIAQTYVPGPGKMIPAPPGDDINKVIKPVEISGLDDTMAAIQAITQIVERGSGATAIEKGQPEKGEQTLGEIQILVGKANERTTAMAKFYRMSWYEFAWKWDRLMTATAPTMIKLMKIGKSGKAYPKTVTKGEWLSERGYEPIVRSSSEQEVESAKTIQKFMFLLAQFPQNMALKKISQTRMLELVDLTPEEITLIKEAEDQVQAQSTTPGTPLPPEQVAQQIQQSMAALTQ